MRLVVTSTAGNAVGYAGACVRSVASQRTGYGPDGEGRQIAHWFSSSDGSTHLEAIQAIRAAGDNATAELSSSVSPLVRLVPMWLSLDPADVVIWLDGDDELEPRPVERVASFHELEGVWMTYGSFVRDDGLRDYEKHPCFGRRYTLPPRSSPFRASHLRTFRAGLFHKLALDMMALWDAAGQYYRAAPDVAVMTALLELAGERYLVATDVLCRYNYAHAAKSPEAIHAQRVDVQRLGMMPPLERLALRPW